jgi:mono/diheme cytochrome c family protein
MTSDDKVTEMICEVRNSKFEIRNKSKIAMIQCSKPGRFGYLNFGFWNLFRISGFGFRNSWLTLFFLLAAGCEFPGRPTDADRPGSVAQVEEFGPLYTARCAGCHGTDGKLGPAPPLNDPIFLAIVPDDELLRVIYEGRTVTAGQRSVMPAFGLDRGVPLSDTQLKAITESKAEHSAVQRGPLADAQIRVLAEGIKIRWRAPAQGSLPPYLSPTGGKGGNAEEGKRVFARACAGCHGVQANSQADILPGPIADPALLALISDKALRRIIITGRPDLGMPAYNDANGRAEKFQPLSSLEIDHLVALLASWRRGDAAGKK